MYCIRCGNEVQGTASFCPACGSTLSERPAAAVGTRVNGHLRILGILWLAISAFRVIPGIALLTLFGYGMPIPGTEEVPIFVNSILRFMGVLFLVAGALGVAAGWGLLVRQPWARMLAIIVGSVGLLDVPFGTALGIYTLWVLLPGESEREYRLMARAG